MLGVSSPQIRIAVLDDHAVVRVGIVARLSSEPGFVVTGSYESSNAMIAGLRTTPADVLLVDYSLGPSALDGISLIRAMRSKFPQSRVLILSALYDPVTVALAMRWGAHGFVGKTQDVGDIVSAIRTVASGANYLSADMSFRLSEASIKANDATHTGETSAENDLINGAKLSVREREVIRCYLDGMSITQIAEKFGRSVKTISTQKSTAFRKLGVTNDNGLFKMKSRLETL